MSITFYVNNDEPVVSTYECMCIDNGHASADCPECHGTGVVTFTNGRHELNMANGNAIYMLRMLGIDDDGSYCGTLPHKHLRLLEISIASALEHNDEVMAFTANNYWRRKLLDLQALITFARGTDQDLHWS